MNATPRIPGKKRGSPIAGNVQGGARADMDSYIEAAKINLPSAAFMEEKVKESEGTASGSQAPVFVEASNLDSESNVVLVVGEGKRITVNPTRLAAASPVFGAMFGPHWGSRTEYVLEGDDEMGMGVLCSIVHNRNEQVRTDLDKKEIISLTDLAHKYQLNEITEQLKPIGGEATVDMQIMAVAYLFRQSESFQSSTQALIFDYTGRYWDLRDNNTITRNLPLELFCM